MSGRRLAIVLFLLALALAFWRAQAISRRVEANSVAALAERNLAAAFRRYGGALPRRFLEDELSRLGRARERDPASVEAAVSQAGFLFLLHRHEQAEKAYFEALAIEERAEIYGNLARLYLQEDRPGDAVEPLRKAMMIDPQLKDLLEPMLENARKSQEAKEAAERARQNAGSGASVPSIPPTSETADLIFSDDFESGQWTRWTRVEFG